MIRYLPVCLVLGALQFGCAQGQTEKPVISGAAYFQVLTSARKHLDNKEFGQAVPLFEQLTSSHPDDIEMWLRLGQARSGLKQFRAAAEAYQEALVRGGVYTGSYSYRIAQLYAQAGDKEKAFVWLEKALAAPLEFRTRIANDEIFAAWKNDERFRRIAGLPLNGGQKRDEGWRSDLDFLGAEMRRMYYGIRHGSMPASIEKEISRLRERAPQLSDSMMEPEIQRIVAMLGDGHSIVRGGGAKPVRRIPFQFYWFSDGLFVIDGPSDCDCVGARVISFGDTPTDLALRKLEPYISRDNAMGLRWQTPLFLRRTDYLRAAGVIPSENEVALTLEGAHGKRQITAKPEESQAMGFKLFPSRMAGPAAAPRYLRRAGESYWFELLPGGKTLYFQFNQVMPEPDEDMNQFGRRLQRALTDTRIRNLIVDMRNNTGGNLDLFPPILRNVISFEAAREKGAIYVITGRQTFSAAQVFVNQVDSLTSAIFAGEPTGSKPNFIGEGSQTRLPYSGLMVTISTRFHQTEDMDQRTWIAPKIPVDLSSKDYFANRDPALDAVMAVIAARE